MVVSSLRAATVHLCVTSMHDIRVLSDGSMVIAPLVLSTGGDGFDGRADSIQVAPLYRKTSVAGGYRA